ncbi:folate-binding protein YgfZ [Microcoleus sp. FACHB-1515]|uniref:CAF17-like 4Fe-4S cluster assembly/insertion protein YgfZ n=1 Tax=Cyanophyceae TaxID=3028117 RepID=UPI00168987E9|nr:folate-binding protein YgfZ [Microcoleus sp. FACHB-1515]MBD2091622.1 folate-binding protein YgfZ [Microcoleus sp. FACHB-1515]
MPEFSTSSIANVVVDQSHWGRIQVSGDDRLRFLHNQTTNDLQSLKPGQGCETVFVTSTGRTIDLVTALVLEDSVLLLTSPGYDQRLIDWMDRYIFFADRVELKNLTSSTVCFTLIGSPEDLRDSIGFTELDRPYSHQVVSIAGIETRLSVGTGLALPGYTLIASSADADALRQHFSAMTMLDDAAWEKLRIEQGRPMPDRELTEDYNPLEAGLWHTISLSKGCYIGQETIARLHTYRGVKQQLWGVRLDGEAQPETPVFVGDEKVGKLTSAIDHIGLAYIRTKAIEPNLKVKVGDRSAELVALPYLSHEYI